MSMATVIPIITKVSLTHAGTVTSLAETVYNLGWLIGTPAGSVLYENFGMFISPLICGSLLLICALVSSIKLPQNTAIHSNYSEIGQMSCNNFSRMLGANRVLSSSRVSLSIGASK